MRKRPWDRTYIGLVALERWDVGFNGKARNIAGYLDTVRGIPNKEQNNKMDRLRIIKESKSNNSRHSFNPIMNSDVVPLF